MIVVPKLKLKRAQETYPSAKEKLLGWYQVMRRSKFITKEALIATFGELKQYDNRFQFQIPGSSLQIRAIINFETQVTYIERIVPSH